MNQQIIKARSTKGITIPANYIDQFSVVFGKAASLTREVHTHTHGRIEGSSSPLMINGTTYAHGSSGGGTITTTNTTWENAIIIAEDGNEYPVKIWIGEPFLREGSDVALTLRNGVPVVITNLNSRLRHWLNGGPEAETPRPVRDTMWFVLGGLAIVAGLAIGQAWLILVGCVLCVLGFVRTRTNAKNEETRKEKQRIRTAFLIDEISKRVPGWVDPGAHLVEPR